MTAIALTLCLSALRAPLLAQRPAEAGSAKGRVTDAQIVERTDTYLSRLNKLGYIGGALIVRDGRTIFKRSYGMADVAKGIRADTATVYNLGSITKQFTAAAILRLEELGKLHTTDSIYRFFPNAPADKRSITLHQLLTHTAGFKSDYSPSDYEPNTRDEYISRMLAAPLQSAPGAKHFYANSGYSMLAAIVELVTHQEYEQALHDLVLKPAGMLETGYTAPKWAASRIAHGYQNGRDWGTIVERISKPGQPYWALRGNGGLHTTLSDIARWDAALNDNRMLTDSSRTKFMTGYVNEGPMGLSQYAYGWAVMKTSRGTRLVTHNGGNGVYVAELLRFVDDHVTIFLTSTMSTMTATPAVAVISKIVFGEPYQLPPERVAVDASTVKASVGTYRLSDGSTLTLSVRDGRLWADAVGQQAFHLLATGDTTSSAQSKTFNDQSRAIVQELVRGNVQPLLRAVGPDGGDSADVAKQEAQLMTARRGRFGEYRSFDVLGSAPDPEGGIRTTVRLRFANGDATNLYTWDQGGHIVDIGARPYESLELLPTASGEWQTLDARGAPAARLRLSNGRATATTSKGSITLGPVVK